MGLSRAEERAAWYLAGIFDGEGSVCYKQGKQGLAHKAIKVSNTDKSIINVVLHALDMLEIAYYFDGPIYPLNPNHTPYYNIVIATYAEIERFYRLVPVQAEDKQRRLRFIVECQRRMMPRNEWPLEEISRLYWDEGLTIQKVADSLALSQGRVQYYMAQSGIPTRGVNNGSF